MATTVGIIRAIGVVTVPPVYLNSLIDLGDIMLHSEIDNETLLKSKIKGDSIKLKSKITLTS